MELGFPRRRGGVDPRELGFLSPFVEFLDIWNEPWTGDGTLSSPGVGGSIIYEPRPTRDRPVGGIGDFHTVRGGIIPDIYIYIRVCARVVGVVLYM